MLLCLLITALLTIVIADDGQGLPLPTKDDIDKGNSCQYYMCEYNCHRIINQLYMSESRQFDRGALKMSNGASDDAARQGLIRQLDVKLKPRAIYVVAATGNYTDCEFGMQLAAERFNPAGIDTTREFARPMDLGNDDAQSEPTAIENNKINYRENYFGDLLLESQDIKGCFNEEVPLMPRAAWPGDARYDATASIWMKNRAWATPTHKTSFSRVEMTDMPTLTGTGQVAHSDLGRTASDAEPTIENSVPEPVPGGSGHHG